MSTIRWGSVIQAVVVAGTFSLLVACGGGGDDGGKPDTPPPPAGLLPGADTALAKGALTTVTGAPAARADVVDGVILSRIEAVLGPTATVAQFNAAARSVGAVRILSASTGLPFVTLEVPRASSVAGIRSLAAQFRAQPGIHFAAPGRTFDVTVLPERSPGVAVAAADLGHMLVARFPQAWNARGAVGADCLPRAVTAYVWDNWGQASLRPEFLEQIDSNSFFASSVLAQVDENDPRSGHGYDVALVAAAKFDATRPTGAQPFTDCLLVRQIEAANLGFAEAIAPLATALRSEGDARFLLNASFGYPEPLCGTATASSTCTADALATTPAEAIRDHVRERVYSAAVLAFLLDGSDVKTRMLVTVAAGNVDEGDAGLFETRYRGFRDARFVSPLTLAVHLGDLRTLLTDPTLWRSEVDPRAPDATFSVAQADEVVAILEDAFGGALPSLPASSVLIVDSASCGTGSSCSEQAGAFGRSQFNYLGGQVRAVGEKVQIDGDQLEGTSFAAPQVAGLAAYLWSLSPALESQPVSALRELLLRTGRPVGGDGLPLIDAYAAVLQLDSLGPAGERRIRHALVDANEDGNFDHLDLLRFREAYRLADPSRPTIPVARDFSRFDLNGDGFTGGILTTGFDLDAGPLDPAGQPVLGLIERQVEGVEIRYNEAAVSDLQILCSYAYSDMYAAAPGNRDEALRERTTLLGPDFCIGAKLAIDVPGSVASTAPVIVTVTVPDGDGERPAPNLLVSLASSCGTVTPASGRTDAAGAFAATVDVGNCTSARIDARAQTSDDGPLLGQQVAEITVASGGGVLLEERRAQTSYEVREPRTGTVREQLQVQALDGEDGTIDLPVMTIDKSGTYTEQFTRFLEDGTSVVETRFGQFKAGADYSESPALAGSAPRTFSGGTFETTATCDADVGPVINSVANMENPALVANSRSDFRLVLRVPSGRALLGISGSVEASPKVDDDQEVDPEPGFAHARFQYLSSPSEGTGESVNVRVLARDPDEPLTRQIDVSRVVGPGTYQISLTMDTGCEFSSLILPTTARGTVTVSAAPLP